MNKHLMVLMLLICSSACLFAQEERKKDKYTSSNRTYLKVNVLGLPIRNYSLQAERTLGKHFSLAIGFRSMPNGTIPLKQQLTDFAAGSVDATNNAIDEVRVGNTAITPEIRWYVGKKGYGRGFYLAPFYRYARFDANDLSIDYSNVNGDNSTMKISGTVTSGAAGLLLGAQWRVGKFISLDWWIIGPHYGQATGVLKGVPVIPLTLDEQQSLRTEMEKIEIPFTERTVNVTATSAKYTLDGPWGGIRTGFLLGFHF